MGGAGAQKSFAGACFRQGGREKEAGRAFGARDSGREELGPTLGVGAMIQRVCHGSRRPRRGGSESPGTWGGGPAGPWAEKKSPSRPAQIVGLDRRTRRTRDRGTPGALGEGSFWCPRAATIEVSRIRAAGGPLGASGRWLPRCSGSDRVERRNPLPESSLEENPGGRGSTALGVVRGVGPWGLVGSIRPGENFRRLAPGAVGFG